MTTTLDPVRKGTGITLSGGNLIATVSTEGADCHVKSLASASKGQRYCEVTAGAIEFFTMYLGIIRGHFPFAAGQPVGFYSADGFSFNFDGWVTSPLSPNTTIWTTNDVLGFLVDVDAKTMAIRKNGGAWETKSYGALVGSAGTGIGGGTHEIFFAATLFDATVYATFNFGPTFAYAKPSGALEWGQEITAAAGPGRKVTSVAVSDGVITGAGLPTHWAAVDAANSRLLASGQISGGVAVSAGSFTLAPVTVVQPYE